MGNINRLAKKFVKRELGGKATCESLGAYLERRGFKICPYTVGVDDEILIKHNLMDYANEVDGKIIGGFAFMHKGENYVFIKSTVSDKLWFTTLLHETAHIALGHLENEFDGCDRSNDRILEMEAEAFSYAVINYSKQENGWKEKLKADPYRYIKRKWRLKAFALIKELCEVG